MQGSWERRPLLRDRLGNKAGDQTLEVIRPMMVPLGARQHARVGCGACWSIQMSETKNNQAEGWPAAQGTEVVHLVLEVCIAGQDSGVAFGAFSELTPGDQLPPVRARTALHLPAAHPFLESLSRLSSASVSPQRDWSQSRLSLFPSGAHIPGPKSQECS